MAILGKDGTTVKFDHVLITDPTKPKEKIPRGGGEVSKNHDIMISKELQPRQKRVVSFGTVEIRTYNRIVGDHPDCIHGPPLSLSWEYIQHDAMDLNQEEEEESTGTKQNLKLTATKRQRLLKEVFEIPQEEIDEAESEAKRVWRQRLQTKNQSKTSERAEILAQSAKRKFRRIFFVRHESQISLLVSVA